MPSSQTDAIEGIRKHSGKNFSAVHAGKFAELRKYEVKHPLMEKPMLGKLFLKELLGLTGMQVSFGIMKAHSATPFSHKHKNNEELYIFTSGKGQIQIDGQVIDVEEGSAVRVAPEGERSWRNNSDTDLHYIVIQAKEHSLLAHTIEDGLPGESAPTWQ